METYAESDIQQPPSTIDAQLLLICLFSISSVGRYGIQTTDLYFSNNAAGLPVDQSSACNSRATAAAQFKGLSMNYDIPSH